MKKFVLLLAAIMCMQVCALASPDNVTTGPYKLSFDINQTPSLDYTIDVSKPVDTEAIDGSQSTKYNVKIADNLDSTKFIYFLITKSDKVNAETTNEMKELALKYVLNEISVTRNIETASRTIDGTTGTIGSCDVGTKKAYAVMYYPITDKKYTTVIIISSYPWEEGTLSLLKTIHIEKIKAA